MRKGGIENKQMIPLLMSKIDRTSIEEGGHLDTEMCFARRMTNDETLLQMPPSASHCSFGL